VTNTSTPASSLDRLSGVWTRGQCRVNVVRDILDEFKLKDSDRAKYLYVFGVRGEAKKGGHVLEEWRSEQPRHRCDIN
jgi:hypothetical protein